MSKAIHVVQTIPDLHRRSGGPSRVVVDLCDALSRLPGLRVSLVSQHLQGEAVLSPASPSVKRCTTTSASRIAFRLGVPMQRALNGVLGDGPPELIHNHGIWTAANQLVSRRALRSGWPLIIQTHGMLSEWALRHKPLRKRLAMVAYQRSYLEQAKALVATSEMEYDDIRRLGLSGPVGILPNGVDVHLMPLRLDDAGRHADRQCAVGFLGRLYPVKGLENLIAAWARSRLPGWRLLVAGPDEAGHQAELFGLARRLDVEGSVQFLGELGVEEKASFFRDVDVLVLPSFTENFGIVVAEALAQGIPVITTKGTPWSDLPKYDCGWWVDIGIEPLAGALREAMEMDDTQRASMGCRGQTYVQRYCWTTIAEKIAAMYHWIHGEGPLPGFVRPR